MAFNLEKKEWKTLDESIICMLVRILSFVVSFSSLHITLVPSLVSLYLLTLNAYQSRLRDHTRFDHDHANWAQMHTADHSAQTNYYVVRQARLN